jgi:coatomer protein complex subunit gamma
VLLRRCLFDGDDEVRDRATLYLKLLGGEATVGETEKDVNEFLFGSLDVPLVNLQTSLRNYEPSDAPFDISSVPKETKSQPLAEKKSTGKKPTGPASAVSGPVSTVDASYEKLLSSIPEFADFGKLFKVCLDYFCLYGRQAYALAESQFMCCNLLFSLPVISTCRID